MAKIYTRSGDSGETGLYRGPRVGKDCLRIEAYGTVDELNSSIGLLRAEPIPSEIDGLLETIQNRLFEVGAELATPDAERYGTRYITTDHVRELEAAIDRLDADLEPLTRFILPGGGRAGALAHLARTVCRRAERRLVALTREALALGTPLSPALLAYLNRLSDLLFVLARWLNRRAGKTERPWDPPAGAAPTGG
ncbi:MAG: cob(I)yrinic acid a,c-diamide adenosyltransferase [Thermogutta sp.]|nr:cob(I)yrinic acid a,c-diamide adenosyltransferase [Thermogutta sp.]